MHPPTHTHTQLVKWFTHMRTRLHPWPTLRGPTVLCCCPRSSHGTQSVGKNAHKWIRARATARTDSEDRQRGQTERTLRQSVRGSSPREHDGWTRTETHAFTRSKQATGTLTSCPGNGSGCFGRFWAPTAPYGQCVFVCVCKCV